MGIAAGMIETSLLLKFGQWEQLRGYGGAECRLNRTDQYPLFYVF